MSKILRVNMSSRATTYEDVPDKYKFLGGRGLTSTIIYDEVDATCHPLGPNNKLVFAPGIVTGTNASTSGRVSVGGKSPLTGGIKESNAGTGWSQLVARLGLKAIVVEGYPTDDGWWGLHITKDGATFFPADEYAGKGLYEVYPLLFEKFGQKVGIAATGVAGEKKSANAGICFNDIDNRPSRYSGRGGLGGVMGSKHLKFIVVDGAGAPGVEFANKELFDVGRKKVTEAIRSHDLTKPGGALNLYGTAVLVNIVNEAGGLPTRNFREGRFEGAAKISGEAMSELCETRGGVGMMGHPCHPGCIIQCSNVIPNPDGTELVSVIEYETTWALGANCGIDDLDVIGKLTWMCNDLGMDTIEAGNTIAVAMEAGLAEFGDGKRAIELMEEIYKGTPLGHILSQGTEATAKAFGVIRCPTVKGQAMPAYEPRAIKGIGYTYAISTMGADHTSGYTIASEIAGCGGKVDQFEVDKTELVRAFQYSTACLDCTGHCLFVAFPMLDIPTTLEGIIEECNGVLGTDWTTDDAMVIGKAVIDKELAFNRAAGLTKADDRLPEFMKYEKLPPHNVTWDVPDEMLDAVFED
ncbi:MAG: aldehyde ferredoxin oxidoreductase [Anaerolineaceae bacterium 4572_32.1]|nr:MAG: aldehyde ferredoxin oxidoreductase [Anaerolineaceae bacterium 4572_32.1]